MEGVGEGKIYGKLSKNAVFPGKFHDNKIWNFCEFYCQKFVVIWEAPIEKQISLERALPLGWSPSKMNGAISGAAAVLVDCGDLQRSGLSKRRLWKTVSAVVTCWKTGGFDDVALFTRGQGGLLLRPRKSTKVTKMAGVTHAKTPFRQPREETIEVVPMAQLKGDAQVIEITGGSGRKEMQCSISRTRDGRVCVQLARSVTEAEYQKRSKHARSPSQEKPQKAPKIPGFVNQIPATLRAK